MMKTCLTFEGTGVAVGVVLVVVVVGVVVVVVFFGAAVFLGAETVTCVAAGGLATTGAGGGGGGGRTTRSTRGRRNSAIACDCALVRPNAVVITRTVASADTAAMAYRPVRVRRTS